MAGELSGAFPAGDESDGSNDGWDIGYSKKPPGIQNGAAVVPDAEDVSRFKTAMSKGDVEAVEQLLDSGVDVETRLGFGWTPLMSAVHVANYDLAKLLLDRGASVNFSKDQYTVLMAGCTASANEDRIVRCVQLLLSRNADPNMVDRCHMTCLMLVAKEGYSKVINLLVSHGAEVNTQDTSGYTALSVAVQYGREGAVLKLLQLGADKTIKTKAGKSPAELAEIFSHTQISRILACSLQTSTTKEENLSKFLKTDCDPLATKESFCKLSDIELLLHGLDLGYLADIMAEHDITWSYLLTMEKDDLQKIGITEPEDQQKVLSAMQGMRLDQVDLDTLSQLDDIDNGSMELNNFLIGLRQQCCYLGEVLQDVISRFPQQPSELVLTLDPKQEAEALCNQLVVQIGDLQKEVACLRKLLCQMDEAKGCCQLPQPDSHGNRRRRLLTGVALSVLGASLVVFLCRGGGGVWI
ncbi:ankyrin repeat, SAM and basic leucine zipper domain-containing protein 1 [Diretmus argenteus]